MAVPDVYEVSQKINTYKNRLRLALSKKYEMLKLRYEKSMSSSVFKEPRRMVNDRAILLDQYIKKLEVAINNKRQSEKEKYVKLVSKLDTLSPLKTLTRGYSIIEKDGKTVNSVKQLENGIDVDIRLIDGKTKAKIIS